MNGKSLAFYTDSPIIGGHERVTADMACVLADKGYKITFLSGNKKISSLLIDPVEFVYVPVQTKLPMPFIRNLSIIDIWFLKKLLGDIQPDALIVSQGDVEFGIKGLLAGRFAGLKVISYMPMAYTFREVGAKFSIIRDCIDRFYYQIPHAFITISQWQKELLLRFTRSEIKIVRNPIEESSKDNRDGVVSWNDERDASNDACSIRFGVVGRVYFRQKGQDRAVDLAQRCIESGLNAEWLFVGDGPDMHKLQLQCSKGALREKIQILGNRTRAEVAQLMEDEIDILLITSRYEGVPLVFLEAISRGIPVIAWRAGWLNEYKFPKQFILSTGSIEELKQAIKAAKGEAGVLMVKQMKDRLSEWHTHAGFCDAIGRAVEELVYA